MREEVFEGANEVAERAAAVGAAAAREAVAARGRFVFAVSGGRTPATMLRALAAEDVPWDGLRVVQVDERVAPDGHSDRNLGMLRASLLEHAPVREDQVYPMPVEEADLDAAAAGYTRILTGLAGAPAELDLVHLGLGADGHTASLVPGDDALEVADADVAVTGVYQGRRRMTLTFPVLDRARQVLWLVTGAEKAEALQKLRRGEAAIPAGRVSPERALLLADSDAAGAKG
jgi:6-phosphogluconolactonase